MTGLVKWDYILKVRAVHSRRTCDTCVLKNISTGYFPRRGRFRRFFRSVTDSCVDPGKTV